MKLISVEQALQDSLPIIDVRSPLEYEKGHIPRAINVALFSNEERAEIGTVYKQESQEAAIQIGYKYANPKREHYIEQARKAAPNGRIIVHCWRGGMRSQLMAEHLENNGLENVQVISGGYKAFRNYVLNFFQRPLTIKVIGGYTGSGKTEILHELCRRGKQIIDLEGLAQHKGSAFGGIGQNEQPSVEQFENLLYQELVNINPNKTLWLEDENRNIGKAIIPEGLYLQMQSAKLYFLDIPAEERAKFLVSGYADQEDSELEQAIKRIRKRLGGLRTQKALDALADKDYYQVALISLNYYDKAYAKGVKNKINSRIYNLPLDTTDLETNANKLLNYTYQMDNIKLTAYSHGAGCGCKIAPAVLSEMLKSLQPLALDKNIIIGNHTKDDAAVYDMGDGTGIISTTDFFMPIVDDPFVFGQIAATNAISDIFAMGGDPMMAIAIFGWPIDKLPTDVAAEVLAGGRDVCAKAGSPLVGGHSIDSQEPIFGLAVTGKINLNQLKRNDTAKKGAKLYLTKPLGVGILSTAEKQRKINEDDVTIAKKSMTKLNSIGKELGKISGVNAMTDVTGFGLLGHLVEICEGSKLSAKLYFSRVPVFSQVAGYVEQGCVPGGTYRNWESYSKHIKLETDKHWEILCDPQTSGGLLISVDEDHCPEVEQLLTAHGLEAQAIGEMLPRQEQLVEVL